jgi:hypothetical protein
MNDRNVCFSKNVCGFASKHSEISIVNQTASKTTNGYKMTEVRYILRAYNMHMSSVCHGRWMGSKVDNPIRGAKNAVNYINAVLSSEYKFGGVNSPSNAVQ